MTPACVFVFVFLSGIQVDPHGWSFVIFLFPPATYSSVDDLEDEFIRAVTADEDEMALSLNPFDYVVYGNVGFGNAGDAVEHTGSSLDALAIVGLTFLCCCWW